MRRAGRALRGSFVRKTDESFQTTAVMKLATKRCFAPATRERPIPHSDDKAVNLPMIRGCSAETPRDGATGEGDIDSEPQGAYGRQDISHGRRSHRRVTSTI